MHANLMEEHCHLVLSVLFQETDEASTSIYKHLSERDILIYKQLSERDILMPATTQLMPLMPVTLAADCEGWCLWSSETSTDRWESIVTQTWDD